MFADPLAVGLRDGNAVAVATSCGSTAGSCGAAGTPVAVPVRPLAWASAGMGRAGVTSGEGEIGAAGDAGATNVCGASRINGAPGPSGPVMTAPKSSWNAPVTPRLPICGTSRVALPCELNCQALFGPPTIGPAGLNVALVEPRLKLARPGKAEPGIVPVVGPRSNVPALAPKLRAELPSFMPAPVVLGSTIGVPRRVAPAAVPAGTVGLVPRARTVVPGALARTVVPAPRGCCVLPGAPTVLGVFAPPGCGAVGFPVCARASQAPTDPLTRSPIAAQERSRFMAAPKRIDKVILSNDSTAAKRAPNKHFRRKRLVGPAVEVTMKLIAALDLREQLHARS